MGFRLRWIDNRLAHQCLNQSQQPFIFGPEELKEIWHPDINVVTRLEKTEPHWLRFHFVTPDVGEIQLTQMESTSVPCDFDLAKFPFDNVSKILFFACDKN